MDRIAVLRSCLFAAATLRVARIGCGLRMRIPKCSLAEAGEWFRGVGEVQIPGSAVPGPCRRRTRLRSCPPPSAFGRWLLLDLAAACAPPSRAFRNGGRSGLRCTAGVPRPRVVVGSCSEVEEEGGRSPSGGHERREPSAARCPSAQGRTAVFICANGMNADTDRVPMVPAAFFVDIDEMQILISALPGPCRRRTRLRSCPPPSALGRCLLLDLAAAYAPPSRALGAAVDLR